MKRDVSLIVAAAGEGSRMKAAVRKPFLDLGGTPVLYVTLQKFSGCRRICQVILCLHGEDYARREVLLAAKAPIEITDVVLGGASRTDSVANALGALKEGVAVVLIHDAVRPFVSPRVIEGVIEAAERHGAAIAAAPVKDTIKRVEGGLVLETVPREGLFLAQTPQGFRREVIEELYRGRGAKDFTDDAILAEESGRHVAVVESDYENFKITTAQDMAIARAMVSRAS